MTEKYHKDVFRARKMTLAERKKHINWCSKHQHIHVEFPMYWSCSFPNRKKNPCPECNGRGFTHDSSEEIYGCYFCEGKKYLYQLDKEQTKKGETK